MGFKMFLCLCLLGALNASEKQFLRQVENHLLLQDADAALLQARKGRCFYPESSKLRKAHIKALARASRDKEALSEIQKIDVEEWKKDPECLKEVGWAILKKGFGSSQYSLKLASLIAFSITQEAKAIPFLLQTIQSKNNILKQLSFQLAAYFPDQEVKEQLMKLFDQEQNWSLRLRLIETLGRLQIKEKASDLKAVLGSEKTTYEEKAAAVKALVQMYDKIDLCQLRLLLFSPISGLRQLGLELGSYFQVLQVKDRVLELLKDDACQVRLFALQAMSLYYKDFFTVEKLKAFALPLLKDPHPPVAVEAALLLLFLDRPQGEKAFLDLLLVKDLETARYAAGRLQKAGKRGGALALKALDQSQDPFVKANLALALLSQRTALERCFKEFDLFFKRKKELWMWEEGALCQSRIKHVLNLPNYPKYVDQKVQLDLLLLLAGLNDAKAVCRLKKCLLQKTHGLTSFAAWALLQEGGIQDSGLIYQLLKDQDPAIRVEAALILALYHKDKSVLPILEKAYFEANYELKLEILGALGFIGDKSSLPFLLKRLNEPLQILKIAASAALIQVAKA